MAIAASITKILQAAAAGLTSRRAIAAAPVVAVSLVVGISVLSTRSDPAKVATREDAAPMARRWVSTSEGVTDVADGKAKVDAKAKATSKAKADGKTKASTTPGGQSALGGNQPGGTQPGGKQPGGKQPGGKQPGATPAAGGTPSTTPATPSTAAPNPELPPLVQGTPPDPSLNLIGAPPEPWPDNCRCAPLTGMGIDSPFGAKGSAVAIKVSNAPRADPQTGLNRADLIYEEPAHGIMDASRFLAVFHSREIDTIGAVRSARTSDMQLLLPLGRPIFAYAGSNDRTEWAVSERERDGWFVHASERQDGTSVYSRADQSEHGLFVSRNNLQNKYGGATAPPNPQFSFMDAGNQNASAQPAKRVDLLVAGNHSGFLWDAKSKMWLRFQAGKPHVNKTNGAQIGRSSVIVLTTRYQGSYADMNSMEAVTFPMPGEPARGQAFVLTGPTVTQGTWSRSADGDLFDLRDLQGRAISLQRGPVYVGLVSSLPTVS